ncbi:MAG: ribose ABC transporter permease [Bacteroidetes bacterium]|nr:MAG: ribose ABC transporter permease [Bacteroidota bacterium]
MPEGQHTSNALERFKRLFDKFGIGIALLIELILFSQLSEFFFTADNILNVTLQTSITAIIAAGMTFVILTGGIDLSVGALVALTGIVTTSAMSSAMPMSLALPLGLLVGGVLGFITGIFVTKLNITPFIVTLAMMTICRGLAFIYTDGRPIWEVPPEFSILGNGRLLAIPIPTIIMLGVYVVAFTMLHRTRFGRYVYAVGGNKEAARLAGISTNKVLIQVYILSGALASLSGILLASRMNSGQPNSGLMYELDVIAAVVVGGTSLTGGRGTIVGTFIGAMLIGVLRNGLNLLNVSSYVQMVMVGVVILLAVLLDQLRKK